MCALSVTQSHQGQRPLHHILLRNLPWRVAPRILDVGLCAGTKQQERTLLVLVLARQVECGDVLVVFRVRVRLRLEQCAGAQIVISVV